MTYLVVEIQKTPDNAVSTLVTNYEDQAEAESKYHQILMYASKTSLPCHTAMIIQPNGIVVRSESYGYDREG